LLAVVCFGVYSNNFRHDFLLDDGHSIERNIAIRNLASIPSYFTDPATFTVLRANIDYRPILLVTYAINYALGGYDTWWWHLTQILLHLACVLGLYFVCRAVLREMGGRAAEPASLRWIPLLPALVWAAHPTASGVVNYMSARSSLLTAAFLLWSFVLYLRPAEPGQRRPVAWGAAVLFALAIFTKVEAVAALAVYFLWDTWQTARAEGHRRHFFGDLAATLRWDSLRRLAPILVIAAGYFVIRWRLMAPFDFADSRRASGATALDYFWTQTVVWWEYIRHWFAPVGLVADHGNYPVYRSPLSGPVPLALLSWIAIGSALLLGWKRRPWLAFVAISALALLSPTSSISPLSEMLNEHRPYLPVAILSLAWMIPLGLWLVQEARKAPAIASFAAIGVAVATTTLGAMTLQRNHAFSTNRAYLEDIVAKAPSGRALTNYGLIFMREGDYQRALALFTQALEYTPRWHTLHINLGIVHRALGDTARAEGHFDQAVEYDKFAGNGLAWRGEHRLLRGQYAEAARDFEAAQEKSNDRYPLNKGLAAAYAGLGDIDRALAHTEECLRLDRAQTGVDIVQIVKPFFDRPERAAMGLAYFERLERLIPDTWWVYANIATLSARLGNQAKADSAQARATALRPAD